MSHYGGRERCAFILQFLQLLETYQAQVTTLVETWPDDATLGDVSSLMDAMQSHMGVTPELIGKWVALSISHTELVVLLARQPVADAARFDALEAHLGRLLDLEGACLKLMDNISLASGSRDPSEGGRPALH